VPNLLDFPDIRFDWRQAAVEIPFVSPVLDSVAPLLGLEEIRQGAGDIAVADDRARLPGAPHRSFPVNHAEALWDERVFAWVAEQLGTPLSQLAGDVDCGRPTGGVRFTPSTVVFDQVRAGQVRTRIVRATNGTADPVRLSFAAARTDLPFQWGALDVTLPPGEVADFEVRYRAPDGRDRTEELRVTSSQSTRPHAIGLVVHGVGGFDPTPEEPPPPTRLSVPPVISFGSVALGQESRRDLVVRNDTGRLVRVIVAASPAGSVFRWPALDTSVANGTQRSLTITFRPSTGAIVQSQVLLRNDLPASPLVVGLVGKGPGGFEVPDGDGPARSAERTVTD
jgi:hypothetical protein